MILHRLMFTFKLTCFINESRSFGTASNSFVFRELALQTS